MEVFGIYSGGEFINKGKTLEVLNKYNGKAAGSTFLADEALLDKTITAAQKSQPVLQKLSASEKSEALRYIGEKLTENKNKHARLLSEESGKPLFYAMAEVTRAATTFNIASEECKRLPREYLGLDWTTAGKNREGLVKYFPAGIVAGISPFNFPLNLAVHKIAPAIAAGCPIILKPASSTPLSTLALAKIISETGLPAGSVNILPMDRKTGNLLATDERIKVLSFTGSPEVGWELKKQSGKKKVVLELGGNAAVIITGSADPEAILDTCVTGAFAYSGQICIHAQRFYVHPAHYDTFLRLFVSKAEKLTADDPLKEHTRLSNMIDEQNAGRVEQWVREAKDAGAEIMCGGSREGAFMPATVLTGTNHTMKVNAEEVFGPVVCIEKYDGSIANAVELVNNSRFGLQCGIFTDSVTELDFAFSHLEVGGVIHNDVPTLRFDHMPYGGVKDSGLGREGVKYAIMDMMETRVLVK